MVSEKTHKQISHVEKLDEYISFEGLKEVIAKIESMIPTDAIDVYKSFDIERNYGYYDSIDIELQFRVTYWLPLTEEEIKKKKENAAAIAKGKREAEKKRKQEEEERDRREYERLKKKFEEKCH